MKTSKSLRFFPNWLPVLALVAMVFSAFWVQQAAQAEGSKDRNCLAWANAL